MRLMVTGSTARHFDLPRAAGKTSFSRELLLLLRKYLAHKVEITAGPLRLDELQRVADTYDLVIVGVASPWSFTSKYTYQVAAWAQLMANNPDVYKRTVFVLDTPEPLMQLYSYRLAAADGDKLFHDLYMGRPEAFLAGTMPDVMHEGCEYLAGMGSSWPRTLIPVHAWHRPLPPMTRLLPAQIKAQLIPVNVDHFLMSRYTRLDGRVKQPSFGAEQAWLAPKARQTKTRFPQTVFPTNPRGIKDIDIINKLTDCLGLLVPNSPYSDSTYWTRFTPLAMVSHSPAFAAITETHWLGASWAVLPTDAEDMSRQEQLVLSHLQGQEFVKATPPSTEARDTVLSLLAGTTPEVVKRMRASTTTSTPKGATA